MTLLPSPEILPEIRPVARALIKRGATILVQHKIYETGTERFTLPGGGAEPGEMLTTALMRECAEEIGTTVHIDRLLFIAEVFKPKRSTDTTTPLYRHQIEHIFLCHVADSYTAHNGPHPDKHQHNVFWLDVGSEKMATFFPQGLVTHITPSQKDDFQPLPHGLYLGQIAP